MIFGKSKLQVRANKQQRLSKLFKFTPWFAWRPVRLYSGRWAWLMRVYIDHRVEKSNWDVYSYEYASRKKRYHLEPRKL